MSEEQHFPRKITKELKADAQRVIDAFWKDPETVTLRNEFQRQFKEDGREVSPQVAVEHYRAVFDIAMPMTIGQIDDDQYMDVSSGGSQDDQEYTTGVREIIEEFTESLGFENVAFNQAVVAMVLFSTLEVRDIKQVPFVLLPSPWSVVRNVEGNEEHLDLRIKGRTAREYRDADKFHKRFSDFFTRPKNREWGAVNGERKRLDAECIEFFKRYEELKSDPGLRNMADRYARIGEEFAYSPEAVEKKVKRGRKLVKENQVALT